MNSAAMNSATRIASRSTRENILGRAGDGIVEMDAPTISRRHAQITIGDPVVLDVVASKNRTWLDQNRSIGFGIVANGDSGAGIICLGRGGEHDEADATAAMCQGFIWILLYPYAREHLASANDGEEGTKKSSVAPPILLPHQFCLAREAEHCPLWRTQLRTLTLHPRETRGPPLDQVR
jgi:FHA domain